MYRYFPCTHCGNPVYWNAETPSVSTPCKSCGLVSQPPKSAPTREVEDVKLNITIKQLGEILRYTRRQTTALIIICAVVIASLVATAIGIAK